MPPLRPCALPTGHSDALSEFPWLHRRPMRLGFGRWNGVVYVWGRIQKSQYWRLVDAHMAYITRK